MSARFSSCWSLLAALLIAGGLTSAALAQTPDLPIGPKGKGVPQTAPAPAPAPLLPPRIFTDPLLLEEEQSLEHGDRPHAAPPTSPLPPRIIRDCGTPSCAAPPDEVALRCLLFSLNPLSVFIPMQTGAEPTTPLPAPQYVNHAPHYIAPSPCFPSTEGEALPQPEAKRTPELIGLPCEVERLSVMPVEVETLDVMPAEEEESQPQYELLGPWTDEARVFHIVPWSRAQVTVGVAAERTETPQSAIQTGGRFTEGDGYKVIFTTGMCPFVQFPELSTDDVAECKKYVVGIHNPSETFEVIDGHTRLIHLKEAPIRIEVGDTHIADQTIIGPATEVLLQGLKVGSTSLRLWFGDRDDAAKQTVLAMTVKVLPDADRIVRLQEIYKALEGEINRALPDAYVCLTVVGEKLVVTGEVKDAVEANRIMRVLTRGYGAPQQGPAGSKTENGVQSRESTIVNLLRTPAERQVQLKLTLVSMNHDTARKLGLVATGKQQKTGPGTNPCCGPRESDPPTILDGGQISQQIEALREKKLAKTLAEPTLVTLNGSPAVFFSGSTLGPLPVGINLSLVPVLAKRDRIGLTVNATVSSGGGSEKDEAQEISSHTRSAQVEMRAGQTFAVGGLLPEGAADGCELVLLVSPEIIEPVSGRPAPVATVATENPPPAPCPAKPQVLLDVLIVELAAKSAQKLNLTRPADVRSARWVIEDADETRHKSLQAGLLGLREKGRAKVLAEPRLTTLSGQQASFLSGGERAVVGPDGLERVGVDFEFFGTKLTCHPVVLSDGTIRLEVEPEISELCATANVTADGKTVPGRSSQRVHTTADIAAGHTLVLSGPKGDGKTRLVVLVTPTVIAPPVATEAPVQTPDERVLRLMNESENLRQIEADMEKFWMCSEPSRLTPERVHTGVSDEKETVHDLLLKCQRELSRGHYAAAEDLAQQALTRDRKLVASDPLVTEGHLLEKVKRHAVLPLGTVEPCAPKGEGRGAVPPGEAKAIGSDERMTEALMEECNRAFREGRYRDAAALAESVLAIDPDNAVAAATRHLAINRGPIIDIKRYPAMLGAVTPSPTEAPAQQALGRFREHYRNRLYEEARADALQALAASPGDTVALAALQQAAVALARQPRPADDPTRCPYPGNGLQPVLRPVDPAVVSALQKLLIDRTPGDPAGGVEEAEPHDDGGKPMPRR